MADHRLPIGEVFVWDITTHNISGASVNADATPRFYFFEENADSALLENLYIQRSSAGPIGSWNGMYVGSGELSLGNGFEVGKFYSVVSSGRVNSITAFDHTHNLFILPQYQQVDTVQQTGVAIDRTYWADIKYTKDNPSRDEFTVFWFKDNVFASGTSCFLQVIKRSDGTNQIATTAMSNVGSYGFFKHDETASRLDYGQAYLAKVSGVVDGVNRQFYKVIYKDSGNV